MNAPAEIIALVDRFSRNAEAYRSSQYNETQARREFIDPFFKCLGWDIDNTQGFAEAYKDVVHEDAIKVGGHTKAPDYSFRIGGTRKFFLEAKRPSVNLKTDPEPAFQLRRYGWSARLPLSILTDFEEFAVYDCRVKPAQTDKAAAARVQFLTFTDYLDQWDSIAEIFSKDAVLKGSFDKYAETSKLKKGTATVNAAFLKEIEGWRELLAKNIALRNDLSQRELNYSVQVTIDRILFLRMCEDRGVELYGQLAALQSGGSVYSRLNELFRKADQRYNSGLFHFEKEHDRSEPPDELTAALAIDDKPLKEIFKGLYYPDSPYEFSVLPAEILGQVYEQFLGKVIRLTSSHRAVVEEKPEVRKAGGVYYTPAYIVDYIVKNTVGKLLDGKTPKQAGKLKILDPACGSGSFLSGAYQFLLDWHRDRYFADGPAKHPKELFQGRGGAWHLSSGEKKRILLNNIFGVDIDPQAVEVTKLSLLLKVLEGESQQTLELQRRLYHERALPDLANNIRCGNSLIGPDFYDGQQMSLLDEEERYRVNVFDWKAAFPAIMKAGGFDAVIGNPPYIRIQTMHDVGPEAVKYLGHRYKSAGSGNYDIYVVFVEKGITLLKTGGVLGFILPSKFFATDYGEKLREILSERKSVLQVVDFGHAQVFEKATTYTCLLFLTSDPSDTFSYKKVLLPPMIVADGAMSLKISSAALTATPWSFSTGAENLITDKLYGKARRLADLPARIGRGSSSGNDNVFILRQVGDKLFSRDGNEVEVKASSLRIPIYATDFGRYRFCPKSNEKIIFPYRVSSTGYTIIPEKEFQQELPMAYRYLASHRKELDSRKQFKEWYGFSAPRNLSVHDSADFIVPLLADRGLYCRLVEPGKKYCLMASGGFSITIGPRNQISKNFVLGLLNSRLLFWRLKCISNVFRGGWITCTKQYVETLPIQKIDFNDATEKNHHDQIDRYVEMMLDFHERLSAVRTTHERQSLETQIAATDRRIDNLVYELYGLTPEEIKIVEYDGNEATAPHDTDYEATAAQNGEPSAYGPYQPALDAGISPEMDRVNFRRLELAQRESRGQLTPEEDAEFAHLQESLFAYVDTIFPRPSILDDDRLEKLEQKYKTAGNS